MTEKINEIPFHEARSADEVMVHTLALLNADIPGFIIRYEGEVPDDVEEIHRKNIKAVRTVIDDVYPENKVDEKYFGNFVLGQKEIGKFHHDVMENKGYAITTGEVQPLVHTTISGGGKVIAAHLGTNFERAKQGEFSGARGNPRNPEHPHNTILSGEVDPELVSPNVYFGAVKRGDSVVLAGGYSTKAAWHRMDTDPNLGYRDALVTELVDPTAHDTKAAS